MNRRVFLANGIIAPFATISIPIREVRKAITIANSIECHVIVSAHFDDASAERHRRDWIGRPFEGFGEFYVDSRKTRPLPPEYDQLPGTLTHNHTTIGVAAEKRSYLVAAVRRENISVVVRILGDNESVMLDILQHVANVPVPSRFETIWSEELVAAFIPGAPDLGFPVEESSAFWP